MTLPGLAARNLGRNRLRTILTVTGVAVAVLAFILIRTVIAAWEIGVTAAAPDRLVTRHKVTFVMSLPKRYIEDVRSTPGVKEATWATWFGGKNPKAENDFFMAIGVEPESYFGVYDDFGITQEELQAFSTDRQACVVGDVLATKFGWKKGDTVKLVSDIYAGEWEFRIAGIYQAVRKSAQRDIFLFDWDYLNEAGPERTRDQIGWITSRVDPTSGKTAAQVALVLDAKFDEKEVQTLSQDEGTFQQSFLGMMSTILQAMNVVGVVILAIMMLILGNTVAMGVRERVREYGIMRAVGFMPKHVVVLVVGEAAFLGIVGGLLGVLIAIPVIMVLIGPFLEQNMSIFFPIFRMNASTAVIAVAIAVVLGALAGVLPALQASRLNVIEALRQTA